MQRQYNEPAKSISRHQRALNIRLSSCCFLLLHHHQHSSSSKQQHRSHLTTKVLCLEERGNRGGNQTGSWNISHITHSSIFPFSKKPILLVQWLTPGLHNRGGRCQNWSWAWSSTWGWEWEATWGTAWGWCKKLLTKDWGRGSCKAWVDWGEGHCYRRSVLNR